MEYTINSQLGEGQFNTLAQSGTGRTRKSRQTSAIVYGNGSDLCDDKQLKGKAQKKLITSTAILSLIKIAEERGDCQVQKAFWNTYHCYSIIKTSGGRSYGEYCKNRFCTVCSGNRKAELMRKYLPVIQTWSAPQFVTLTIRSCKVGSLNKFMAGIDKAFKRIHNRIKQRYKRGKGIKIVGIRSIECNFNPKERTYNPHIHLIVENRATADLIGREWLKIWTKKFAYYEAQYIKTISDKEKALVEVIKYGTKIFTEPDPNNKKAKAPRSIYSAAMYNIIISMKKIRLFERFGFNLPASSRKASKSAVVPDSSSWNYDLKANDWINEQDEQLSGYLPDGELSEMLACRINSELE
jgi:hypothetical protein